MGTAAAVESSPPGEPAQKLAAVVAERIENDIIEAGWPIDHVLGSEDEMRDRYGVSRAVLREAIRLVEHHSAAVMRRGPGGGLVVKGPLPQPAIVAMVVYLEYAGTTVEDLLQARLALEPLAAALAANQVTERGVEDLRAALAAEAHHNARELASPATDLLHLKIAELSDNPPVSVFVEVLSYLTRRYAEEPSRVTGGVRQVADEIGKAHHAIVEAIVEGNASLAEHRASRHLQALGGWLKDHRAGSRTRPPADVRPLPLGASGKLAEVVAGRIYEDLLASGHPVGHVLGSESDLLERYDVSRAVLREAVRLLEHHSIARMRRGPGGGLVLAAPDPTASVKAMALYLEFRGYDVQQLRVARDAVELACLDMVTARSDEPVVRQTLEAALEHGAAVAAGPRRDAVFAHTANDLHAQLCALAGNPALELFAAVLTSLWERHSPTSVLTPRQAAEARDTSNRAHRAIIDAVLAGDASMARRRMRKHLDGMTAWWQ